MMKEINPEALVLFKDYTFLQLKSFSVGGGTMSEKERMTLNDALEYHRMYTSLKLNKNTYGTRKNQVRTTKE